MRPAFEGLSDLAAVLARIVEADAGDVETTATDLVEAIAERLGEADLQDPRGALSSFRARDLAIAIGCLRGQSAAIVAFEREHGAEIDRALSKSPTLGLHPDELRQIILEKLFVAAAGETPRIAQYGGRATLSSWVRVTCARTIIDLSRRAKNREIHADEDWLAEWPDTDDPELRLLRARYAPLLPNAFAAALEKLAPRQRNLLRQRFVHDISAQTLAASYGVHRATIFSWIEQARRDLLSQVRVSLRASVASTSLDSLVEVMGSAMELSIRRLLDSHLEDE